MAQRPHLRWFITQQKNENYLKKSGYQGVFGGYTRQKHPYREYEKIQMKLLMI